MLILTFEEFNNKFGVDNKAMSNIRIEDIGKDVSLTTIGIVMRDQRPDNTSESNFNTIVNLHPTDGTHWVLVKRREGGPVYYFDSSGVESPPLFLEEYVDLGSNERIKQYDESYWGDYCFYMIYLIDRGFRIKTALNILVNQVKCPGMYNECLCLGCENRSNDNIKVTGIVNDNYNIDQGTCFADIKDSTDEKIDVNDNVKVNDNVNDNNNVIVSDNVNDNVNVDTNDNQGTCFADDNAYANDNQGTCSADDNNNDNKNNNDSDKDVDVDSFIYLFGEKHPRVKHIREAVWEPSTKAPFTDNP